MQCQTVNNTYKKISKTADTPKWSVCIKSNSLFKIIEHLLLQFYQLLSQYRHQESMFY
jgi:hypothetical protein